MTKLRDRMTWMEGAIENMRYKDDVRRAAEMRWREMGDDGPVGRKRQREMDR